MSLFLLFGREVLFLPSLDHAKVKKMPIIRNIVAHLEKESMR